VHPLRWGVLLALAACGRTELDAPDASTSSLPAHPACASASGVRLCGGLADECPVPADPPCIGYGCTDLLDYDGNVTTVGVCWADTAESDWRCDGCSIGDGCLQRRPGEWICVPIDVCDALWDLGARDVCRYADKSRYDHRPIPSGTTGCPANASTSSFTYRACGGDCPPCVAGQRCNGVAPDHPFGICNGPFGSTAYDPSYSCGTSPPCHGADVCAVPDVAQADLSVGEAYGTCMPVNNCFQFASDFPGGLRCY